MTVGHKGAQELIQLQEELLAQGRAEKMKWSKAEVAPTIKLRVDELAKGRIAEAINQKEKQIGRAHV